MLIALDRTSLFGVCKGQGEVDASGKCWESRTTCATTRTAGPNQHYEEGISDGTCGAGIRRFA